MWARSHARLKLRMPINSANGNVLSANLSGAAYQWLDCDNGFSLINGETNQSFTASTNGNYAVKVTQNGCNSISDCISISNIGLIENTFGQEIIVFPNPTAGDLTIDLGEIHSTILTKTLSLNGQLINENSFNNTQMLDLNIDLAPGYYYIEIRDNEDKKAIIKILKK